MRRLLQSLLALLLILGLVPGLAEIAEQAVELVSHGHFAHTSHGTQARDHVENSCSPIQHTCPCHEGAPSTTVDLSIEQPRFEEWLTWMMRADELPRATAPDRERQPKLLVLSHGAAAPPTPPPNATV